MSAATITLTDGDAVLRMLGRDDLPATLAWRNDPRSRGWFHSSGVIEPDQHATWFERYLEKDDDHVFVLEVSGEAVAQVALYGIAEGSAEFGRLLVDPAARGRGHSHTATALCLRVADDILRLTEIHLEVKRDNERAIAAYRRAGFSDDPVPGTDGSLVMRRRVG